MHDRPEGTSEATEYAVDRMVKCEAILNLIDSGTSHDCPYLREISVEGFPYIEMILAPFCSN